MLTIGAAAAFTSDALVVAFIVPIPIAIARAVRVSVTLGVDGAVVIRNPTRTHRLQSVAFAVPRPTGPRGQSCINFIDADGRAVSAYAMLVWSRGFLNPRPSASTDRLETCLQAWVARCRKERGVIISLDLKELDRVEFQRQRFRRARYEMSLTDPAESLRTVRRAMVGDVLISVRPSPAGFRVYVDATDGSCLLESMDHLTLHSAIDEGIAEIQRRRGPSS
jgi:hypothetical protein